MLPLLFFLLLHPPPDHLTIRGEEWTVNYHQDFLIRLVQTESGFLAPLAFDGVTDCEKQTIDIYEHAEELEETVLHEALHAYTCDKDSYVHNDFYNSPQHGDHPGFDAIAFQELQLIHDNPQLVAWIANGKLH